MPHRILVVAPNWVGDAVMTAPLIARLKSLHPASEIDVLAPEWTLAIFERMPHVNSTHALPFGHGELKLAAQRAFAASIRGRYHHAVVLPNSLKSALIPWLAGIPQRTGYHGELRWGVLNDRRKLDKAALPLMVERFAALAEPCADLPKRPVADPRLMVDHAVRDATVSKYRLDTTSPIVALCPGAEYGPAKRWPTRHFAALAQALASRGMAVWIFGSGKDAALAAEIVAAAPGTCVDLTGKTTLAEAIDLMSLASRVVSNDSGLMHVAAALDRPVTAIFGSSSPTFTPPLSNKARIISLKLECSPCYKRECPLGHLNCLNQLVPERVLETLP